MGNVGFHYRQLDFVDRVFVQLVCFALGLAVISLVIFFAAWAITQL